VTTEIDPREFSVEETPWRNPNIMPFFVEACKNERTISFKPILLQLSTSTIVSDFARRYLLKEITRG
jgi:hypothetical protein